MLAEHYDPNDALRRPVGRKEINDYAGGMVGITMLIGSVAIIAGVLVFSTAISDHTRTAQYSHASKRIDPQPTPPVTPAAPRTQ
jgi:hypothetical protein